MTVNDFIINPKDAKRILVGSDGRLSPSEFAQGLVAILAVWAAFQILSLLPAIGGLISVLGFLVLLVLAYSWICIFAKRFHDAGKSGWLAAAAALATVLASIVLSLILSPLTGPTLVVAGEQQSMMEVRPGLVFLNLVIGLIVNAGVGYYAYSLKRQPVD